jgi:hypothetical protein
LIDRFQLVPSIENVAEPDANPWSLVTQSTTKIMTSKITLQLSRIIAFD